MRTNRKKILKIGIPILGVVISTTLIVCVSGILVKIPTISVGGSTAVLPLMSSFSNHYKGVDIVTSAGGSSVGINSIIDGTKVIGMASKNPEMVKTPEGKKYEQWKNKNVKTLTIAWDGIGLVYKPSSLQEKDLDLNEDVLAKIYVAFSGLKKITFGDLFGNDDKTVITPYARNGGSSISGTADAFYKDSKLDYKNSSFWNELESLEKDFVVSALTNGSYGTNVVQTAEANSQAWNRVKDGPKGSMIYLSSGFIINNMKAIEDAGFKVALYNGNNLTIENITNGYEWYRPFNLMYSINQIKNNNNIIDMLKWILFDKKAKKIISEEGYVPLNNKQIKSMGWDETEENKIEFLVDVKKADYELGFCGAGEVNN